MRSCAAGRSFGHVEAIVCTYANDAGEMVVLPDTTKIGQIGPGIFPQKLPVFFEFGEKFHET